MKYVEELITISLEALMIKEIYVVQEDSRLRWRRLAR